MDKQKMTTVEQIESLRQQINKLSDSLLTDLSKQLDTARKTFDELLKVGRTHEQIFFNSNLPQISDAVRTFNIVGLNSTATPKAGNGRKRGARQTGKCSTEEAIVQALADGTPRTIDELLKRCADIKGVEVSRPSLNGALQLLKKDSKVSSPGRGQYKKA